MPDTEPTDHINANAADAITLENNLDASSDPVTVPTVSEPPPQELELVKDSSTSSSTTPQIQSLSKRARKRLAKQAYYQEKKLERRQREKEAKKEKKRDLRERLARGEVDGSEQEGVELGEPARKKGRKSEDVRPFGARVVVDLGFDSYMTDKEIISLGSQLAFCYSANRRATCPLKRLLFTSLSGRLRARLERENNAGYKRWMGCEWWEEGYEHLWDSGSSSTKDQPPIVENIEGKDEERKSRSSKDAVIYLTADADEELEELKEGETYILGGIVDRNRHKFLCQNKATAQGIRTTRLPIGKHLKELKTRKVLTVNQVFEILVHWTESRNWEEAIYSVMPKRKFVQNEKTQGTGGSVV